jgi:ferredoxin
VAYVITSRCRSNCLQDCVKTCPVDAIHGPTDAEHVLSARASGRPLDPSPAKVQMFIDPETCTVAAPFRDEEVPVEYEGDIQQNADFFAA